jgi:hypothetical protein
VIRNHYVADSDTGCKATGNAGIDDQVNGWVKR